MKCMPICIDICFNSGKAQLCDCGFKDFFEGKISNYLKNEKFLNVEFLGC